METMAGRPALLGRTVHIPDILADPDFKNFQALAVGRFRAFLGVPLTRDGEVFGVIGMNDQNHCLSQTVKSSWLKPSRLKP
jgi:GAF domain-containing protein